MSNADIVNLSDSVCALLATGIFSQDFVPAVIFRPTFTVPELKYLKVTVVPSAKESKFIARKEVENEYLIDVAIQKKVTNEDADVRALLFLVDEIESFLQFKSLQTPPSFWIGTSNKHVYSQEHLSQDKIFTSVLQITYKVF